MRLIVVMRRKLQDITLLDWNRFRTLRHLCNHAPLLTVRRQRFSALTVESVDCLRIANDLVVEGKDDVGAAVM